MHDVIHAATNEGISDDVDPEVADSRWDVLAGMMVSANQYKPSGIALLPRGDVLATPTGMGQLRCSFPTPLFPPGIQSRDVRLPNHRSEIGSTLAPAGNITIFHLDYYGGSTLMCHWSGVKLWITFPMTRHNVELMTSTVNIIMLQSTREDTLGILSRAEKVSAAIIDTKVGFVLSPFTFHAVLTLTPSYHFGGPLYFPDDSIDALRAQDLFLRSALRRFKHDKASRSDCELLAKKIDVSLGYVMRSVPEADKAAAGLHKNRLKQFLDSALSKPLAYK